MVKIPILRPLYAPTKNLIHHEIEGGYRIAVCSEEDSRTGYFWFECKQCGEELPVEGLWIDNEGRLVINCRCKKCRYLDARKIDIGDNPYVVVDPSLRLYSSKPQSRASSEARAAIPPTVRMAVLERDHFACRYCGASGKGVRLEVDHIVPWSHGGKDEMDNLVTACSTCNAGKGNQRIAPPDWGDQF